MVKHSLQPRGRMSGNGPMLPRLELCSWHLGLFTKLQHPIERINGAKRPLFRQREIAAELQVSSSMVSSSAANLQQRHFASHLPFCRCFSLLEILWLTGIRHTSGWRIEARWKTVAIRVAGLWRGLWRVGPPARSCNVST